MICVKNENCEFLQKLCTDFLVALPDETPCMFSLFPQKQRKFTVYRRNLEKQSRSLVSSKNKLSIFISSCHSNDI